MTDAAPDRRPPLLVIGGATATGKTGLAIRVAQALGARGISAEVISADSRQVFRGLDIGTAKPDVAERRGVPHHGLDLVEPDEPWSVAEYVTHVDAVLAGLAGRRALAILAGGTGFYLRAVARGIDTGALPSDPEARAAIEREIDDGGVGAAAARLRTLAPTLAARIDLANRRRVARALEIATARGDEPLPAPRGYPAPVAWVGLRLERPAHVRAIFERARGQFEAGLVEEARALRERFDPALPAFSAIGYRESWAYLDGELSWEAAVELDGRRNLQFAKRQATWFRSEPDLRWFDPTDAATDDAVVRIALDLLGEAAGRAGTLSR